VPGLWKLWIPEHRGLPIGNPVLFEKMAFIRC
jgi:hypothetical protein